MNYTGKGNHSVNQLEEICENQIEELYDNQLARQLLLEALEWIAHHALQKGCGKESLKSVANQAIEKTKN